MCHFRYHFCFEFSSTRIKCAVVLVIEMNYFFIVSTFVTTLRSCVLVVGGENYGLWFLPLCPFALMPLPLPLFPSWFSCSFKFWRLSREVIFCICFHISVFVQISSTLLMLLLPAQMTAMTFFSWRQTTSLPFLAANVEALSKHLKAWRWARRRCRSSRDLRI